MPSICAPSVPHNPITMDRIAVIDFETTGISPGAGARATEVGIVMLEQGRVVDRFASLMNAGEYINYFIESLTGISNAMVEAAPSADIVMRQAARFVGNTPMCAHNASFDRSFWLAELRRVDAPAEQPFACTMLLSRRLYPQASRHSLGSLAQFHSIAPTGRAHRALADAETCAALLARLQSDLAQQHGVASPSHALLMHLQTCPRKTLPAAIKRFKDAA